MISDSYYKTRRKFRKLWGGGPVNEEDEKRNATIGFGAGMIGGVVDALDTPNQYGRQSTLGQAGSGAMKGVAAGAALGPVGMIAGGAVGLLSGLITGSKEKKAEDRMVREMQQRSHLGEQATMDTRLGVNPELTQGRLRSEYFAKGGKLGDPPKKRPLTVVYKKPSATDDGYSRDWETLKNKADRIDGPKVFVNRKKFSKLQAGFRDTGRTDTPSGYRYIDFGEGTASGSRIPLYKDQQRTKGMPIEKVQPTVGGVTGTPKLTAPGNQPSSYRVNFPDETGKMATRYFNSKQEYDAAVNIASSDTPDYRGSNNFAGSTEEGGVYNTLYKGRPKFPDGGQLTPALMNNWNAIVKRTRSKNIKPGTLDHDPAIGYSVIDDYNKSFPDAQFPRDRVKDVQSLMQNYRTKSIDRMKAVPQSAQAAAGYPYKKFGDDFSGYMPGLSAVDNFPGSKTLNWEIPDEYMTTKTPGTQTTERVGYAPLTMKAYGGKLSGKYRNTQATGGSVNPMSSNGATITGNKHAQGGVQTMGAELEGGGKNTVGETIANDYIYSDQLSPDGVQTFAEKHEPVMKAKGKIELKPATRERVTAIRLLEQREQLLATSQEYLKKKLNIA